jgi:uncharacterized membrane protein
MTHRHPVNKALHDNPGRIDAAIGGFVKFMGSLRFLAYQTLFIGIWIGLNTVAIVRHWDPYPFILLNLLFSTQAAYASPLILLAQNRQEERDRLKLEHDYEVNETALAEIRADKELTGAVHKLIAEVHGLIVPGQEPSEP